MEHPEQSTLALVLLSVAILLVGGLGALAASRSPRLAGRIAAGAVVLAALPGLWACFDLLAGRRTEMILPWGLPLAQSIVLRADGLSALFLLPIFVVSALGAIYGVGYLRSARSVGAHWFFYCVLVAAMILVLCAGDAVSFLIAWELMSLASFFLVTFEHERAEVRAAGWTYLIATHLGTALLLAFFLLVGVERDGTLVLEHRTAPDALILLALIGFGTKAGLFPLHVWLPEAHPAAPSHVSAVMSGVMIKTGIYGILRAIALLAPPSGPPLYWGVTLVLAGCASGLFGITFALPQRDVKRLLAYSSIENIGIVTIGLGLGTIGWSLAAPSIALLGYGGAILHVWNHACMKSGLFLVAGAISHAAGTRDLEKTGGLLARMPKTGGLAAVLVVAIIGLPPLNGFVGELVLYIAAVSGLRSADPGAFLPSLAAFGALAAIGGLAAFVFAKAFGIAFLGEPRSEGAAAAHEPARSMLAPIAIAVALSFVLAACGAYSLTMLTRVLGRELGIAVDEGALAASSHALFVVALAGFALLLLSGALLFVRHALLRGREVREGVTWDCGYAEPTARMQYTAASFVEPATTLFSPVLRMRDEVRAPEGIFPSSASYLTGAPLLLRDAVYGRAFAWIASTLGRLRRIQHGHVHLYVLYVALTLLVLLVWRLA